MRSDLEILPETRRGRPTGSFLLRDPHTEKIFQMEEEDYFICQQFDGQTALPTIQERYEKQFRTSLAHDHLEAFIRQLDFQGLLVTRVTEEMVHFWDPEEGIIVVRRYPIFNPDSLLTWLYAHLWWSFTLPFFLVSLGIMGIGLLLFALHWSQLIHAMSEIWRPGYLPLLVLVGIPLVQVPHEFAHGLVSIHYGGKVTEAGLMVFYYILPKFYVNRQQTLAIPSPDKAKFCWIFFIGLYWQLLMISIGVMAALLATPGGYAHHFWTALWSTAAIGALHNANISHRRDAHFLLATWLEIQALRRRAWELALNWIFWRPEPEPLTRRERFWFLLYGVLSIGYYIVHGLIIFWTFGDQVTDFLQGSGLVLFVGVLLYVFQRPILKHLRRPVMWLLASEAGQIKRWLIRFGWAVAIIGLLLLPYPYETGGPFIILPSVQTDVYCEIDGGRISQVYVREGSFVTLNQPLAQIDPREYEKNVQATQAQLEYTEANLRLLRKQLALLDQPPNIEQIQSLEAETRRLHTLLVDYKRQLELTTLRAPVSGRVTTPLLEQKAGLYLKKGDLFATLEQVQALQVEIQVPEGDVPQVRVGAGVKIVPWAYANETFRGSVRDIAPIAAVPQGSTVNSVRVIAEIPNPDLRLKAQLTGFAKIKTDKIPVWLVLSRLVIRWFQVQFWYWLP